MKNISKIKNKKSIRHSILNVVNELGGFEKFVKPGEVVLLKPNFNTADPFPASTDLEFLKTAVELVYEAGAKLVIVGDSSTIMAKTDKVMEKLNIFSLRELNPPPEIINFDKGEWVRKDIKNGKYLKRVSVTETLGYVDKLILLPCLKTHFITRYTGALKLSVGFMKTIERFGLHARHTEEKIAELNTVINPDLIIMDARKCFITKGPMEGEVREPNLIMASTGRVAIDIEGVKIIQGYPGNTLAGVKAEELTQIKLAGELGVE